MLPELAFCLLHQVREVFSRSFFLIVFVSGVQVFPGSYGKESAYNAEDLGSVLGSGRSSEEGNGVKQSESVILPYRPLQRIEQVLKSYRLYI